MQYNNKKPVILKATWTRAEVADMFGICTRTLTNWLDSANYKLRPNKAITLKELNEIFALFGNPNAEREKLAQLRGK